MLITGQDCSISLDKQSSIASIQSVRPGSNHQEVSKPAYNDPQYRGFIPVPLLELTLRESVNKQPGNTDVKI